MFSAATEVIDRLVGIFSPKSMYQRKMFRFAYDAVDGTRTRKKRISSSGTGDNLLTETTLSGLREIGRDISRNNPIIKGMLRTETNGVVGTGTQIQAKTSDHDWNKQADELFYNEMVLKPVDEKGVLNWPQMLRKTYKSYRQDGDIFAVYLDDAIQMAEGEQCGTPWGKQFNRLNVTNGVAVDPQSGRVLGYYIGKPNRYGYIEGDNWKAYSRDVVHHVYNPERFSNSRGEPALTSAMTWIDMIHDYAEAEMVAARVNACFSMFISRKDMVLPDPYAGGVGASSGGRDGDTGVQYQKLEPGMVMYGQDGEQASGIGQSRPNAAFDSFMLRLLSFVGRPIDMPLMLITLDFSGATFMNARIAYNAVQTAWKAEQEDVVLPFCTRTWIWFINRMVRQGKLSRKQDMYRHDVIPNRWPYVDPEKEAKSDQLQLENKTITRTIICARQGLDYGDVKEQLDQENKAIVKTDPQPETKPKDDSKAA
jgi:lambda family phage portal protein